MTYNKENTNNICKNEKSMLKYAHSTGALPAKMYIGNRIAYHNRRSTSKGVFDVKNAVRKMKIDDEVVSIRAKSLQDFADHIVDIHDAHLEEAKTKDKHLFTDVANRWMEVFVRPNVNASTVVYYQERLKQICKTDISKMFVEDITVADVQQHINSLPEWWCLSSKSRNKKIIKQILDVAVEDGIIPRNVATSRRIKITGRESETRKPFSREEMRYLFSHISDLKTEREQMFLAVMLFHPLRPEEMYGLQWQDIDFANKTLHIQRAVAFPTKGIAVVKEPKTKQSNRIMDLHDFTAQFLKEKSVNKQKTEFILSGIDPLTFPAIRKMCERIENQTGFKAEFSDKILPSRFRTTVATDIYDVTKDIKVVQKLLGHTTPVMTLAHYVQGREQSQPVNACLTNIYA